MKETPDTPRLEALTARASDHELGALLKALFKCGFTWDTVRFEGVRELSPGRGELVRSLHIERSPSRSAVIALNTGLLSSSSPLPDYFKNFARRLPDPDALIAFLGFWDSVQLRASAYACFPSLAAGSEQNLSRSYRARLRLGSPMLLHWVFRGAFPELSVELEAAVFSHANRGSRARVGGHLDGRSVIGADFTERSAGFRIRLHAESSACEGVDDWEGEALRRIGKLGPCLSRLGKRLEIVMRFERYRHGHTLVGEPSERRQLGTRPWLRARRHEQLGPAEVVLISPWSDLLPAPQLESTGREGSVLERRYLAADDAEAKDQLAG